MPAGPELGGFRGLLVPAQRFNARSVVATRKVALFDQVRGCGLARHAFGDTSARLFF